MTKSLSKKQQKHLDRIHKLPQTPKQLETALQNLGIMKGKPYPHEGNIFGDDIVEHHNDLCHGAERPDDVSYITSREHSRLHGILKNQTKDSLGRFTKQESIGRERI